METPLFTQASLASALLEAVKILWRKYVAKNDTYDFPKLFYVVALPVMQVVAGLVLLGLGMPGYELPTDWKAWALGLVQIFVASLVSILLYESGLKRVRGYVPLLAKKSVRFTKKS